LRAVGQQAQPASQDADASRMIRRMVRAQRPHRAPQPKQSYTWPVVSGCAPASVTRRRTALSLRIWQEQDEASLNRKRQ
jgi:hypothetical protein